MGACLLMVGLVAVIGTRISLGTVGDALALTTGPGPGQGPISGPGASTENAITATTVGGDAAQPNVVPATSSTTTVTLIAPDGLDSAGRRLEELDVIALAGLSPKSVVFVPGGRFFAQNMMYNHTISVFDRSFRRIATIADTVRLDALGHPEAPGEFQGSPVEAAATPEGRYVYVSNYQMYGPGFDRPGDDLCGPDGYDNSFVYRVDVKTLRIDQAIEVGAVPKFLALTPDGKRLFVSNWCSYDVSVVDLTSQREISRIPLGPYPRGIAMDAKRNRAYVAVMGSADIATIDLGDLSVGWIRGVGPGPRHLVMDSDNRWLYATLNSAGVVAKIDPGRGVAVDTVATGSQPRTMAIADDGASLYVVNYGSQTVAKVRAADLTVLQSIPVGDQPIGITYDPQARTVWVALYGGALVVLADVAPK